MKEYQPLAISNFRTGFDEAVEPWLLPRDAYQLLKNAHLYRGVLEKIPGYDLFARMSYRLEVQLTGVIDGGNKVFMGTLAHIPSTNKFIAQSAINAGGTLVETFTYFSSTSPDIITLHSVGVGTGTVNLTTLAVTLTFNTAPAVIVGGYNSVIFSYDFLSTAGAGTNDIMGIKQYFKEDGSQEVLVFNTRRVGKVIVLTDLMATLQGADNGIAEIPHEVHVQAQVPTPVFDGATMTFMGTIAAHPAVPGSVNFVLYSNVPAVLTTITDNGIGLLTGVSSGGGPTATGFINYATGAWTITFSAAPAATDTLNTSVCVYGDVFTGDYTNFFSVANYTYKAFITNNVDNIRYYDGMCLKYLNTNLDATLAINNFIYPITRCLHVAIYRDRLLLLLPTINSFILQNGVAYSANSNPLDFTNNGILLAPTSESIRTFSFITINLVIRFSNSERIFTYTGDAFAPFRWDTTNSIFRCDARYSAINYDSYFTSVGKPAIVASDGVNIKRADEIIPDFTLSNRALFDGPIISMNQTSIGQCYGERFDDFKEGWLCFKEDTPDVDNQDLRSDAILAYNYLDGTYAVYDFPFNCLGYGTVSSTDTWGNNFDLWGDADYAWGSFYEELNALIDLAGDRNGVVYTLGKSNTRVDEFGVQQPVLMDVVSKNFNPFIEQGELCRLGYVDLFVSANTFTKLRVQFFLNDELFIDASGNPAGFYQETTLTFLDKDAMSPVNQQKKVWKRIYVGAVGKEHTIRFYQNAADFTDATQDQPVKIHAMVLYMKPAGRIFN